MHFFVHGFFVQLQQVSQTRLVQWQGRPYEMSVKMI